MRKAGATAESTEPSARDVLALPDFQPSNIRLITGNAVGGAVDLDDPAVLTVAVRSGHIVEVARIL